MVWIIQKKKQIEECKVEEHEVEGIDFIKTHYKQGYWRSKCEKTCISAHPIIFINARIDVIISITDFIYYITQGTVIYYCKGCHTSILQHSLHEQCSLSMDPFIYLSSSDSCVTKYRNDKLTCNTLRNVSLQEETASDRWRKVWMKTETGMVPGVGESINYEPTHRQTRLAKSGQRERWFGEAKRIFFLFKLN